MELVIILKNYTNIVNRSKYCILMVSYGMDLIFIGCSNIFWEIA